MHRSMRYPHIPEEAICYIFGPVLLFLIGLGLLGCGVGAVRQPDGGSGESKIAALLLGLVTIVFETYAFATEVFFTEWYNHFVIMTVDAILMVGLFIPSMSLIVKFSKGDYRHNDPSKNMDIAVLTLCMSGWLMSLLYIVLLSIAVRKHRRSLTPDFMDSYTKPSSARVLEDLRSDLPGAVQDEDTSVNINVDGARKSVHYITTDPYHPLRLHPVDTQSTIRSVPPEMKETTQPEKFPRLSKVPAVVVHSPTVH